MKPVHAIAFFVAGTALMILFYKSELLLFLLMSISAMLCLAMDGWKHARMFILSTLIGGVCENLSVMLGAWKYAVSGYLPTPIWVPVGWGLAMILFREGFGNQAHEPKFSKRALALAFGGAILTGFLAPVEYGMVLAFVFVTIALFASRYYKTDELKAGILAGVFGAGMEISCILNGNWHYPFSSWIIPLWLPLAWFNAFLIMRRIAK
jgi:uncharacterized membrane protein YoaT (DUF817 family)